MLFTAEAFEDLSIFRRNRHRKVLYLSSASFDTGQAGTYGINGIRLEMIRERSKEQLVEHAALFDIQIVLHLAVTPVCEVLWMVVNLKKISHLKKELTADSGQTHRVESITPDQCYSI